MRTNTTKTKKRRVDPPEIKNLIAQLTQANGLSHSEVRKARAAVRRIAANKEAAFIPFDSLAKSFFWYRTLEGFFFWNEIHRKIKGHL